MRPDVMFSPGDRVACMYADGSHLREGRVYTVASVDGVYVSVKEDADDDGTCRCKWWAARFRRVEPSEDECLRAEAELRGCMADEDRDA